MALYDDAEDEDTRRRRREGGDEYNPLDPVYRPGGPPPGSTAPEPTPDLTPAQPVKQADAVDNAAPPPVNTDTRPSGGGPQPQFQPPAPQMQAAPAPAPAVKQPGITDEVTRILMERLKALQNPGDVASDPIYQNAVKQYQIGQLRSADKQRKSLAERSAATTGTTRSGGFNVGVRGIQERAGENAAQYRSGLTMDRLQAREQQLVQAIQMARAVGQDDIANQLEVQRLQLQQELGRGDLALRSELGRGQLGLGQDTLGFNYADLIARMNRDATLAALQGG